MSSRQEAGPCCSRLDGVFPNGTPIHLVKKTQHFHRGPDLQPVTLDCTWPDPTRTTGKQGCNKYWAREASGPCAGQEAAEPCFLSLPSFLPFLVISLLDFFFSISVTTVPDRIKGGTVDFMHGGLLRTSIHHSGKACLDHGCGSP